MLAHNLIHKYRLTKDNKYEIWIKTTHNLSLIKKLTIVSRPGWKKYYSIYKIKTLIWKNKNHFYLISAPNAIFQKHRLLPGFISQQQAIELNTGGEILLQIEII